MEHLSKSEGSQAFTHPQKVSVSEFIQSWSNCLGEELSLLNAAPKLIERNAADLNIPPNMLKSLQKDLNPNRFCNLAEEQNMLNDNQAEDFSTIADLETLKEATLHNLRYVADSTYRMQHPPKYRHEMIDRPTLVAGESDLASGHEYSKHQQQQRLPQAVLTVQIFKPAVKTYECRHRIHLDREFEVLSSQPLVALRDSYLCISDILTDRDFSANPLEPLPRFTGHDKAGYFLIENTLYQDGRFERQHVLKRIIDWARERKVGHFGEASMQETRFDQLTIQLGYPYLYTHGNNCEHLLVFTDVRMYIARIGGQSLLANFPKCTASENLQMVKCQMCTLYFSKWLVTDNRRLPTSPFYLCHSCHLSFNYDLQLNKRGSFHAYPIMFNLDRFGDGKPQIHE